MEDKIHVILIGFINFCLGLTWLLAILGILFPRIKAERHNALLGGGISLATYILLVAALALLGRSFTFYLTPLVIGCCVALCIRVLLDPRY